MAAEACFSSNNDALPRKLSGVFNTTAPYNSIDLIPNGLVWVSDTDRSRKETSLSFLLFELVCKVMFRN